MPDMSEAAPRILIVGAGIAGLTLANALGRSGIHAVLIDASPTLEPPGLGLSLQPNGVRALARAGLADPVVQRGLVARRVTTTDANEQPVRVMDAAAAGTMLSLHRNALVAGLTTGLVIEPRLGTTIETLAVTGETARVTLSDGSASEWDLVVGADGLRSEIRRRLFPNAVLEYRNYRAWRTVVERHADDPEDAMLRWGAGAGVGTFAVSRDLIYAFALEHGRDDEASSLDPWQHLHRVAVGFGPTAQAVIGRVTSSTPIAYTPVYEVKSDRWAVGPIVLIGDAAHAIVPMLAQGAALAIEDAILLAEAIVGAPSAVDAAAAYAEARRPRVTEVGAICRFASMAVGLEGRPDPTVLSDHPGNPSRFGARPDAAQRRLWAGIDGERGPGAPAR